MDLSGMPAGSLKTSDNSQQLSSSGSGPIVGGTVSFSGKLNNTEKGVIGAVFVAGLLLYLKKGK